MSGTCLLLNNSEINQTGLV